MQVTCIRAPCNPVPTCVSSSGGSAGSGSAGSSSAGSGGSGRTCGGRGTGPCPDGEYCNFPPGANCGRADASGTCQVKPQGCNFDFNPVCGCDGETYGNACGAAAAGVSVETQGECKQASAGAANCDYSKVACDQRPGPCPDGQVRAVDGVCYGACVDIEACKCTAPAQCPMEEQYTCHKSAGHCGPYV